jgi:hypothetical protein
MAQLPLNTFKTKTAVLTTGTASKVYTAPIGTTAIILMAQVANISSQTHYVSFSHFRNRPVLADAQGNGAQAARTTSTLVMSYAVPANDAASPLSGKMIVESLDSIQAYADANNVLQLTLSVLETANA